MANIHDFIILNKKAEKYAKRLADNLGIDLALSPDDRRRCGFYIYILESICNENDINTLVDSVIDTEFNKLVLREGMNDNGMDAIYIDKENREVHLFNFKWRINFKPKKSQEANDNFTSTKFLNLVLSDNVDEFKKYPTKIKTKLFELSDIFNRPQEEWKVNLYQVSNEAFEVIEASSELRDLASLYAINITPIALPTISSFMSIRPQKINTQVILDVESFMCHRAVSKASTTSYITQLDCRDILRMTCDNKDYRERTTGVESKDLAEVYLDFGVLFDNVRGLVKNSKYNKNIATTLKDSADKFFMYNNGITLIAEDIKSTPLPGNKNLKLEIINFQIVNGGQTIRTIHDFNKDCNGNLENYIDKSKVLVRMFIPEKDSNEAHKIAEYTNSQNPVKSVDIKSLALEQIAIERYLDEHDIAYARKSGDTGPIEDKDYKFTINMEDFGKILKAISGHPEKATNGVKNIFENDYKKLFIDNFIITEAPSLIEKYYMVIKLYKASKYKINQLKLFYVLYLDTMDYKLELAELIEKLEYFLASYETIAEFGEVKTLGSVGFKEAIVKKLEMERTLEKELV